MRGLRGQCQRHLPRQELQDKSAPIEETVVRTLERPSDFDICAMLKGTFEFVHGSTQSHLDTLQLTVHSYDALIPCEYVKSVFQYIRTLCTHPGIVFDTTKT